MSDEKPKKPGMVTIGRGQCPSCGEIVPFKQQSNGHAAVSCSWCGAQTYARSEQSDLLLRKRVVAVEKPSAPAVRVPERQGGQSVRKPSRGFLDDL